MSFSSKPLNNGHKKHRKNQSSNPFHKAKKAQKYKTHAQEEDGSVIFHELDPSNFPLTKEDSLWMESSASDICTVCLEKIDSKLFRTKKRHCKKCGRVVCVPCANIRIRKHRVCIQCNSFYLYLNNICNQWYRTNRNITHSLCGYDSYTLDTCSSLKRVLFVLNHYHEVILLKRDNAMSTKRKKRGKRKVSNGNIDFSDLSEYESPFQPESRAKVPAPFDISTISIKDFVDRLPKYDTQTFLADIQHLKQLHFKKNNEVFKISQYQKNHQWELRAYAWKKIGKCNRYGCQYGIKDIRNKDQNDEKSNNQKEKPNGHSHHPHHKKNDSMISLDQDIETILNNMHVILLHGIDDEDEANGKGDKAVQEMYDLLPQTPLSPHHGILYSLYTLCFHEYSHILTCSDWLFSAAARAQNFYR